MPVAGVGATGWRPAGPAGPGWGVGPERALAGWPVRGRREHASAQRPAETAVRSESFARAYRAAAGRHWSPKATWSPLPPTPLKGLAVQRSGDGRGAAEGLLSLPRSHDRKIMVPSRPAVRPAMVAVGHSGSVLQAHDHGHTCCSAAAVCMYMIFDKPSMCCRRQHHGDHDSGHTQWCVHWCAHTYGRGRDSPKARSAWSGDCRSRSSPGPCHHA